MATPAARSFPRRVSRARPDAQVATSITERLPRARLLRGDT